MMVFNVESETNNNPISKLTPRISAQRYATKYEKSIISSHQMKRNSKDSIYQVF